MTISGIVQNGGDVVISWPWGPAIQEYAAAHPGAAQLAQLGSGYPIQHCAWINVFTHGTAAPLGMTM